jgi:hypothetical protein
MAEKSAPVTKVVSLKEDMNYHLTKEMQYLTSFLGNFPEDSPIRKEIYEFVAVNLRDYWRIALPLVESFEKNIEESLSHQGLPSIRLDKTWGDLKRYTIEINNSRRTVYSKIDAITFPVQIPHALIEKQSDLTLRLYELLYENTMKSKKIYVLEQRIQSHDVELSDVRAKVISAEAKAVSAEAKADSIRAELDRMKAILRMRQLVLNLEKEYSSNALSKIRGEVDDDDPWTFKRVVYEMKLKYKWKISPLEGEKSYLRYRTEPSENEMIAWESYLQTIYPGRDIQDTCINKLWKLSRLKEDGNDIAHEAVYQSQIKYSLEVLTKMYEETQAKLKPDADGFRPRKKKSDELQREAREQEQRLKLAQTAYEMAIQCGLFSDDDDEEEEE